MVLNCLTSLLLGFLFALLALANSSIETQQAAEPNQIAGVQGDLLSVDEGVAGRKWLKERKMVVRNVVLKEKMKEQVQSVGGSSRISGKGKSSSKKSLRTSPLKMDAQKKTNLPRRKSLNSANMKTISTSQLKSQVSATTSTHGHLGSSPLKKKSISTGSQSLSKPMPSSRQSEDDSEEMDLLNMDYYNSPRGTPPINNNHPQTVNDLKP